jgi:hypothetical protein
MKEEVLPGKKEKVGRLERERLLPPSPQKWLEKGQQKMHC